MPKEKEVISIKPSIAETPERNKDEEKNYQTLPLKELWQAIELSDQSQAFLYEAKVIQKALDKVDLDSPDMWSILSNFLEEGLQSIDEKTADIIISRLYFFISKDLDKPKKDQPDKKLIKVTDQLVDLSTKIEFLKQEIGEYINSHLQENLDQLTKIKKIIYEDVIKEHILPSIPLTQIVEILADQRLKKNQPLQDIRLAISSLNHPTHGFENQSAVKEASETDQKIPDETTHEKNSGQIRQETLERADSLIIKKGLEQLQELIGKFGVKIKFNTSTVNSEALEKTGFKPSNVFSLKEAIALAQNLKETYDITQIEYQFAEHNKQNLLYAEDSKILLNILFDKAYNHPQKIYYLQELFSIINSVQNYSPDHPLVKLFKQVNRDIAFEPHQTSDEARQIALSIHDQTQKTYHYLTSLNLNQIGALDDNQIQLFEKIRNPNLLKQLVKETKTKNTKDIPPDSSLSLLHKIAQVDNTQADLGLKNPYYMAEFKALSSLEHAMCAWANQHLAKLQQDKLQKIKLYTDKILSIQPTPDFTTHILIYSNLIKQKNNIDLLLTIPNNPSEEILKLLSPEELNHVNQNRGKWEEWIKQHVNQYIIPILKQEQKNIDLLQQSLNQLRPKIEQERQLAEHRRTTVSENKEIFASEKSQNNRDTIHQTISLLTNHFQQARQGISTAKINHLKDGSLDILKKITSFNPKTETSQIQQAEKKLTSVEKAEQILENKLSGALNIQMDLDTIQHKIDELKTATDLQTIIENIQFIQKNIAPISNLNIDSLVTSIDNEIPTLDKTQVPEIDNWPAWIKIRIETKLTGQLEQIKTLDFILKVGPMRIIQDLQIEQDSDAIIDRLQQFHAIIPPMLKEHIHSGDDEPNIYSNIPLEKINQLQLLINTLIQKSVQLDLFQDQHTIPLIIDYLEKNNLGLSDLLKGHQQENLNGLIYSITNQLNFTQPNIDPKKWHDPIINNLIELAEKDLNEWQKIEEVLLELSISLSQVELIDPGQAMLFIQQIKDWGSPADFITNLGRTILNINKQDYETRAEFQSRFNQQVRKAAKLIALCIAVALTYEFGKQLAQSAGLDSLCQACDDSLIELSNLNQGSLGHEPLNLTIKRIDQLEKSIYKNLGLAIPHKKELLAELSATTQTLQINITQNGEGMLSKSHIDQHIHAANQFLNTLETKILTYKNPIPKDILHILIGKVGLDPDQIPVLSPDQTAIDRVNRYLTERYGEDPLINLSEQDTLLINTAIEVQLTSLGEQIDSLTNKINSDINSLQNINTPELNSINAALNKSFLQILENTHKHSQFTENFELINQKIKEIELKLIGLSAGVEAADFIFNQSPSERSPYTAKYAKTIDRAFQQFETSPNMPQQPGTYMLMMPIAGYATHNYVQDVLRLSGEDYDKDPQAKQKLSNNFNAGVVYHYPDEKLRGKDVASISEILGVPKHTLYDFNQIDQLDGDELKEAKKHKENLLKIARTRRGKQGVQVMNKVLEENKMIVLDKPGVFKIEKNGKIVHQEYMNLALQEKTFNAFSGLKTDVLHEFGYLLVESETQLGAHGTREHTIGLCVDAKILKPEIKIKDNQIFIIMRNVTVSEARWLYYNSKFQELLTKHGFLKNDFEYGRQGSEFSEGDHLHLGLHESGEYSAIVADLISRERDKLMDD